MKPLNAFFVSCLKCTYKPLGLYGMIQRRPPSAVGTLVED